MATNDQFELFGMKFIHHEHSFFNPPPDYSIEALEWLRTHYKPTDNEIYVVTYPKTGTTLTLQICHQIMECYYNKTKSKAAEYYKGDQGKYYTVSEWIDVRRSKGIEFFNKNISATKNTTRFWKTHLPLQYFPCKGLPKKMIICCRNPKDTVVSFYYHMKNLRNGHQFKGSFDTFFTLYVAGLVITNSYFDYYRKYWSFYLQNLEKKEMEIYWLNYEDLVENEQSKRNEIRKLIAFIGVTDVVHSEQDLDRIMERTSIQTMKGQYEKFVVKNFVRKGVVGDWKSHLSRDQSEMMDALIKLHFNGTDFKYYRDLKERKAYLYRSKL